MVQCICMRHRRLFSFMPTFCRKNTGSSHMIDSLNYYHLQLFDQALSSANPNCLPLLVMNPQPLSWWSWLSDHAPSCKVNSITRFRKKARLKDTSYFFCPPFILYLHTNFIFCSFNTHACHLAVKESKPYLITSQDSSSCSSIPGLMQRKLLYWRQT